MKINLGTNRSPLEIITVDLTHALELSIMLMNMERLGKLTADAQGPMYTELLARLDKTRAEFENVEIEQ